MMSSLRNLPQFFYGFAPHKIFRVGLASPPMALSAHRYFNGTILYIYIYIMKQNHHQAKHIDNDVNDVNHKREENNIKQKIKTKKIY